MAAKQTVAVGYLRMSTAGQEASPEQQREEIEKYAESHRYKIARWYEDLAISGDKTSKRAGFQQMVADGSAGAFEAVLCWDQSRFGRFDQIEAGFYIHPLREAGIHLATVKEGKTDWTDPTGRLIFGINQEAKRAYLTDLSANVSRGLAKHRENGRWTTGTPPYGYVVDADRRLQLDSPDVVAIVRGMFERYATGKTAREIAEWLGDLGIVSSRRKKWTKEGVRELLKNERYMGHMIYGQRCSSKYKTKDNPTGKVRAMPRDQWTIIKNTHPAIVDPKLFATVQERLERNRTKTGLTSKNRYALTGLIYCGACGHRMLGSAPHGQRKYICYQYTQRPGACDRRQVTEADALREVLRVLRVEVFDKFFQPQHVEQIKTEMRKLLDAGGPSSEKVNRKQLEKVESQIEQAGIRLAEVAPDMVKHITRRIRDLEDQRDEIKQRLAESDKPPEKQLEAVGDRIEAALSWLANLEAIVDGDFDPVKVNEMLIQFVDRVDFNIERVPYGPTESKHRNVIVGGTLYFRSDSLPFVSSELRGSSKRS